MKRSDLIQRIYGMDPGEALKLVQSCRGIFNTRVLEQKLEKERCRLDRLRWHENTLDRMKIHVVAGVDEAGRGPLAGPVAGAAVILARGWKACGIDDSKKLSQKNREHLYHRIVESCICWSVVLIDHHEIDRINILEATRMAMSHAVRQLTPAPEHLLIDAVSLRNIPISQANLIKGDSLSISIAAASILAKVTRDRAMDRYHAEFPQYHFDHNKGYGTQEHLEALRKYGQCPIHRASFLKNIL